MTHDEQIKELKRDKERLDWLQNEGCYCGVMTRFIRMDIDAAIAKSKSVNTAKTTDPIWDSRNQDYE